MVYDTIFPSVFIRIFTHRLRLAILSFLFCKRSYVQTAEEVMPVRVCLLQRLAVAFRGSSV